MDADITKIMKGLAIVLHAGRLAATNIQPEAEPKVEEILDEMTACAVRLAITAPREWNASFEDVRLEYGC
jgi:hypothetical protein